jgi:hypothetical protein
MQLLRVVLNLGEAGAEHGRLPRNDQEDLALQSLLRRDTE